jgi:DNA-binding transcriptional regulator PaaX
MTLRSLDQIVTNTSLSRNTVDSAAFRMLEKGALVRREGKRGVFALSADTLEKIKHGAVVRIGHEVFEMQRSLVELDVWEPTAATPQ